MRVARQAHDGAGERRLAGPVGADQGVDVSLPEVDAEAVEDALAAELERDVVQFEDPHAGTPTFPGGRGEALPPPYSTPGST